VGNGINFKVGVSIGVFENVDAGPVLWQHERHRPVSISAFKHMPSQLGMGEKGLPAIGSPFFHVRFIEMVSRIITILEPFSSEPFRRNFMARFSVRPYCPLGACRAGPDDRPAGRRRRPATCWSHPRALFLNGSGEEVILTTSATMSPPIEFRPS
jgi:hypothetical protein